MIESRIRPTSASARLASCLRVSSPARCACSKKEMSQLRAAGAEGHLRRRTLLTNTGCDGRFESRHREAPLLFACGKLALCTLQKEFLQSPASRDLGRQAGRCRRLQLKQGLVRRDGAAKVAGSLALLRVGLKICNGNDPLEQRETGGGVRCLRGGGDLATSAPSERRGPANDQGLGRGRK
mmetsp:Transcript_12315/g.36136  ORF Transcript_12315/g.36136 Transcript_12315/m.36136 type:complete len:181 (+) Transcript_12315:325-867(+)